jgi:hypothetical protein
MQRARHVIGAAAAVLLSLSVLGCTGGRPGPSRADLQAGTAASSTLESTAPADAGEDGGQPSGATSASTSAGASGGTAAPGGAGNRVPGAPVSPGNRATQPQARGSPIKVPAIVQVGIPIAQILDSIRDEFAKACGGRLCVKLVIDPANADPETCEFARTNPKADTTVQRDTTVALVCNPRPTETSETTPPGNTDPTDPTTPPDDTTPSDDSQPPNSS